MPPEYKARIEAARPQLYATARQQYGVEINQGPSGIDSRPALIGGKYAESVGKGHEYHDAVLNAYWRQASNIEDRAVLRELAEGVGLDGEAFLAALDDPAYEAEIDADIDMARQYGLQGVPALIFESKYLIPGAVPYQTLRQAVEQIRAEKQDE